MDTDSLYFALSARKLEDVVKPELRDEFDNCKKEWLARDTWSNRTPGLFKLEFDGHRYVVNVISSMGTQKANTQARVCLQNLHTAKPRSECLLRQTASTTRRYTHITN